MLPVQLHQVHAASGASPMLFPSDCVMERMWTNPTISLIQVQGLVARAALIMERGLLEVMHTYGYIS